MLLLMLTALTAHAEDRNYEEEMLLREPPSLMSGGSMSFTPSWIVRHGSGSPMETENFLRTTEAAAQFQSFKRSQEESKLGAVGLALLSGATFVVGLPVTATAEDGNQLLLGLGTLGVSASAFVGTFAILGRTSRKKRDPSAVLTATQADELIFHYNNTLRADLGMEPLPAPVGED
jgi:hypothetical protein